MPRILKPYQYVIDSSALFDLKNNYPERIFGGLWELFTEMFERQQIVAPLEVYKEVKRGDDELVDWVEDYKDNFLEPSDEEMYFVQELLDNHYHPNIVAKYSTGPWADPFVLACSKYYSIPIIQQEKGGEGRIPHVAKKYHLQCNRLVQFFEEENWFFGG